MKSLIKLRVLTILAFSIFFTSLKKSQPEPKPEPTAAVPKNNTAYIYKTHNMVGVDYKTLLEENNYYVTLIDKSKVSTTTFISNDSSF